MQLELTATAGTTTVKLPINKLDATNVAPFKTAMAPVIARHNKLVLDLSSVGFIDSTGLGAILSCLRQLRGKDGDLKLCCLTKQVSVLFELVRMHKVFEIFPTSKEAHGAFLAQGLARESPLM